MKPLPSFAMAQPTGTGHGASEVDRCFFFGVFFAVSSEVFRRKNHQLHILLRWAYGSIDMTLQRTFILCCPLVMPCGKTMI